MTQKEDIETMKRVSDKLNAQNTNATNTFGGSAGPMSPDEAAEFVTRANRSWPEKPMDTSEYDAVEPPHYRRGPEIALGSCDTYGQWREKTRPTVERNGKLHIVIECIEVMRHIRDPRLATALKYIWRVAFGGKQDPSDTRSQREVDERDIKSAVWYLEDWLKNPT